MTWIDLGSWFSVGETIGNAISILKGGSTPGPQDKTELWKATHYTPAINCPPGSFRSFSSAGTPNCTCDLSTSPAAASKIGCQIHPLRKGIPLLIAGVGLVLLLK